MHFFISKGLKNASNMLREQYLIELINCLVEQPLAISDDAIQTLPREEEFINRDILQSRPLISIRSFCLVIG